MPIGVLVEVNTSAITASLKDLQERSVTLKAVRAGIKIVQSAARGTVPKRLKHLYRAQGTKAIKGRKGKTGSIALQGAKTKYVKVVATGKRAKTATKRVVPAFYDHLVIGGVKPHYVKRGLSTKTAEGRKALSGATGKKHPGHRGNPYRERAYNAVKPQVAAEILRVAGAEVQKMLAKNQAKAFRKMRGK